MAQHRKLIRGGTVVSVDSAIGDLPSGDVLVEGDRIAAVAPRIDAADAEVVDATGMIVMPGLVDTHRHVWQSALRQIAADWTLEEYFARVIGAFSPVFTPEDVHVGTHFGAVEALDSGITTIFDWSHIMNTPEHADAAVTALQQAGIRAVFGHGMPTNDPAWYFNSDRRHPDDARRLASRYFSSPDQLLTLALSVRGPELATIGATADDLALARELGVRASMHVGLGLMGQQRAVTQMHDRALLADDLIFLHCNTCTDEELKYIAGSGGHASVSARIEMLMGHGVPATGRLLEAGIRPALSVDVVCGVTGSMFDEMRGVLEAERGRRHRLRLDHGAEPAGPTPTTRDAIEFATIEGARTLDLERRIGSLTPGKQADVILLNVAAAPFGMINNVPAAIAFSDVRDVDTVLVAGQFRKRHGRLLDYDAAGVRAQAERSRDRLFAAAGLPDGTTPVKVSSDR
ncbi:amidohydrolase family protein [Dactylosporangium sp. NPDC005572]|uniref:amidohydrolase family protein n=1 Tax=Dactylosporangium sp. NPDC005572 TaxID=3156889 RepID=UPI0033BD54B8